ncbi:hypothetical protein ACJ5H2_19265 [Nocardioides sp. R1-1]|uniref:hypothetical protein n=1 Tax=Nocardioides sp. R1-1 TaxID=3383502 RepID=UPI0038CFB2AA
MATPQPGPYVVEPLPRRVASVVLCLVLMVVGAAAAGYGLGCTVIDMNGHGPASYVALDVPAGATIGGGIAAIIGSVGWLFVAQHWPVELNGSHSLGCLLLCGAIGDAVAVADLGVGGWYVAVAALTAAAGLLVLAIAVLVGMRRARRYRRELALMASGDPRPATVLDSGLDAWDFEDASTVVTTVTFGFTGADGTSYRLHRRIGVPVRAPFVEGHETVVWHDVDHPMDDRRMVVAAQHALRWNVPLPVPAARRPVVGS